MACCKLWLAASGEGAPRRAEAQRAARARKAARRTQLTSPACPAAALCADTGANKFWAVEASQQLGSREADGGGGARRQGAAASAAGRRCRRCHTLRHCVRACMPLSTSRCLWHTLYMYDAQCSTHEQSQLRCGPCKANAVPKWRRTRLGADRKGLLADCPGPRLQQDHLWGIGHQGQLAGPAHRKSVRTDRIATNDSRCP